MRIQLLVLGLAQGLLPLAQGRYVLVLALMVAWGAAGFGMMPPQQARLAAASPAQAPLLLSLNASMVYLGTALGSVVGGLAIGGLGFAQLGWSGLPFLALGLLTLVGGPSR